MEAIVLLRQCGKLRRKLAYKWLNGKVDRTWEAILAWWQDCEQSSFKPGFEANLGDRKMQPRKNWISSKVMGMNARDRWSK